MGTLPWPLFPGWGAALGETPSPTCSRWGGGLRPHQSPLWRKDQEGGDLIRRLWVTACEMLGDKCPVCRNS